MKKTLIFGGAFLVLAVPALVFAADATGLVPNPGGGQGANQYTVCDLLTLSNNLITYAVYLSVFAATLMFAYGGILYVTASANEGNIKKAHAVFFKTFAGLVIILIAWLLVNIVLSVLTGNGISGWTSWIGRSGCTYPTIQQITTTSVPTAGGSTPTGTLATETLTKNQALTKLHDAGVCGTQVPCLSGGAALDGIHQQTIDQVIALHNACGCQLTITSGVRTDNTPHNTGYKVDIHWTDTIGDTLTHTLGPPSYNPNWIPGKTAAYVWQDHCGNVYAHELNPSHLDLGTARASSTCTLGG